MNRRQLFGAAAVAGAAVATGASLAASAQPRISTEKGDPGERRYAEMCGDGVMPTIFLDGVEQKDCVTADPGKGIIKRVVRTPNGNIAFNRVTGEVYHEEARGRVHYTLNPYA